MKTNYILTIILTLLISSCSDDESAYKCKDCVDTPEAIAANDNSGKGIYKGLIIGSSGTIKFDINNNNSYGATLELDGETYALTTSATFNSEGGFEGCFLGTMNTSNDIEICFYANYNGTSYGILSIDIPGHPGATIALYKEFSDELVSVIEGTFSGDASGTFNMAIRGSEWLVRARETNDDGYSSFYGTLSNGTMTCIQCGDVEITGKISGDEASGRWNDVGGGSGSWKGKRTL